MSERIWLASYPKSGNTWLRMLIGGLALKDGETFDINETLERGGIASAREPFDDLTLIDSGLLTHDEIDRLRPRVYEALARGENEDPLEAPPDEAPVRFVKVHDAYTLTPSGEALLAGARGAKGAIVLVRDPRDVAPSLANHNGSTIDAAIDLMNDKAAAFCNKTDRQDTQLRHKLPGWSGHVASWLDQPDIPVHLIRYEDMKADAAAILRRALAFAGRPATEDEIRRAVSSAGFAQLRQQELDKGFREIPARGGGKFFRRGEAGAWRDELTAEQVACIETAHGPMMERLGYALSRELKVACAG